MPDPDGDGIPGVVGWKEIIDSSGHKRPELRNMPDEIDF